MNKNLPQPVDPDISNPSSSTPDLVALDLVKAYEITKNQVLVQNKRKGNVNALTSDVFYALTLCEKFKTVKEHINHIVKEVPALREHSEEVERVLVESVKNGILVSAAQYCDTISPPTEPAKRLSEPSESDPAIIVIITWERPAALTLLLESMLENSTCSHVEEVYVVDDSRNELNIKKNAEIVRLFSSKMSIALTYFGRDEQQQLVDQIIQTIPEHEVAIRFLLDHAKWHDYWSSGLARNFALLLSVGKRLVILDDDTEFKTLMPETPDKEVEFINGEREARFFSDNDNWIGFDRAKFDPAEGHLEYLGLTFGAALEKFGKSNFGPNSLANVTVKEIDHIHKNSPILISQCGTLGHPGTTRNSWISQLSERSILKMLESKETVDSAIVNTSLWLGRHRFSFSNTANMSQTTGLDNQHCLPPYFPVLRGEDQLFGEMVSYLYPDSVVLDYPWAVPHFPASTRNRSKKSTDFGIAVGFPMFFYDLIMLQKDHCNASEFPDRLQHLSQSFIDLSRNSHKYLSECYWNKRVHFGCDNLKNINKRLARDTQAPENWINFLKKGTVKINQDLIKESNQQQIKGTPQGVFDDELIDLWRGYWKEFGEALSAWPEIREAAEKL